MRRAMVGDGPAALHLADRAAAIGLAADSGNARILVDCLRSFLAVDTDDRARIAMPDGAGLSGLIEPWAIISDGYLAAGRGEIEAARRVADQLVRTVTTTVDLRAFEQVVLNGYPVPPARDGQPTFAPSLVESPVRLRLAYLDGDPVATGASHVAYGVINLGLAATLPAARRRGAWAALASRRITDDLALPAVAFTSDHSRPGLERMGFLPITRFTLWTWRTVS